MVKFNLRKMFAVGLLSATAAFAGVAAMHGASSVVAYATEVTPTEGASEQAVDTVTSGDPTSLSYDTTKLTGNYIYVSYYTDEACTKLKSTTLYLKDEVQGTIPLGSINLKKGGFFKVYDETKEPKDVNAYEIEPQAAKVKAKVLDVSKDKFFEAVEITVGTTPVTAATWNDYDITFDTEDAVSGHIAGADPTTVESSADEFWAKLKVAARANGLTVVVRCAEKTGENKTPSNGMPTEAKFKVAAAPKAPKVTIDYVNGSYSIPKGVKYVVKDIASPLTEDDLEKAPETTLKETVAVNDLVAKASNNNEETPQAAEATRTVALVVWSEKAKKMDSVMAVYVVKELKDLTATYADSDTAKEKATVKLGDKEVAVLTFTSTGVTIDPKADIAYSLDGQKWVTLKTGKLTKKEVAVATGAKIKIKALGTKASKTVDGAFGSAETGIANEYVAPTPSATPTEGAGA